MIWRVRRVCRDYGWRRWKMCRARSEGELGCCSFLLPFSLPPARQPDRNLERGDGLYAPSVSTKTFPPTSSATDKDGLFPSFLELNDFLCSPFPSSSSLLSLKLLVDSPNRRQSHSHLHSRLSPFSFILPAHQPSTLVLLVIISSFVRTPSCSVNPRA